MQTIDASRFSSLSSYSLDVVDEFNALAPLYRPAAHIGDSLRDLSAKKARTGRASRGFEPELFMQTAYVGSFRRASVGGKFCVLQTAEGDFVEATMPRTDRAEGLQSFHDACQVASIAPAGFLLGGWLASNYFHWMCQALPTLEYLKKIADSKCRVVIGRPNGWTLESLELAGIGPDRVDIIEHGDIRTYDRLYFPFSEFGHYYGHYHGLRPGLASFYDAMRPADPQSHGTDCIYISRRNTPLRPMLNEAAFERELLARGFSVLTLEELNVSQQIDRFRTAKLVVAPHGAGLANLNFCREGTRVYELVPQNQIRSTFFRIAQYRNLQYHADCHKAAPSELPGAWNVKFPRALQRIDALLAEIQ